MQNILIPDNSQLGQDIIVELTIDILEAEQQFFPNVHWTIPELSRSSSIRRNLTTIYNMVITLLKDANLCRTPRSYDKTYNLVDSDGFNQAPATVGGHTFLVISIVDKVLPILFPSTINSTMYGYTYREIIEAICRHDLPENIIGDIPDNGERNDQELAITEELYQKEYSEYCTWNDIGVERNTLNLLDQTSEKNTFLGRVIYLADKISAILETLSYDLANQADPSIRKPMMHINSKNASKNDVREMKLCDYQENGFRKASEMWTIDFFKIRRMPKYDDTGYFTAMVIMATLYVNGQWYNWRQNDYDELEKRFKGNH